jgi:molybdopterin-synthase adenylyltransferase
VKSQIAMHNHQISLQIPPKIWQSIRQAMLVNSIDNEETIGFLFCVGVASPAENRVTISPERTRYIPRAWVVPSRDCYELQSASGLILNQEFHQYLLENFFDDRQFDVVHIHTHAGRDVPDFSAVDDLAESEYAQFLSHRSNNRSRLISGVFDESLERGQFRIWNSQGTDFQSITCHRGWLECDEIPSSAAPADLMFARQQVFGTCCQQKLNQLTVALIGCGGIGATFVETLGRLGVKNWILVDPDRLETSNLNRMPGATAKMVEAGCLKVQYVKQLLEQIYPTGAQTIAIPDKLSIATPAVATADIIIVATDNHSSRQIAQEIALKYMRPLVCLGTHIDIGTDGSPRLYARITVPPLGGGWCLMCGNIINLHRAALETAPTSLNYHNPGYIEGIADPAVFWLNGVCASMGAGVIHGLVGGFMNLDEGLDWIFDCANGQWLKTDVENLIHTDCYFCH